MSASEPIDLTIKTPEVMSSGISPGRSTDSPSRLKFLAAARKITDGTSGLVDPYADFDHGAIHAVAGTRYTYHPETSSWSQEPVLLKIEEKPFAKGALRAAHRCLEESISTQDLGSLLKTTAVDWKKARRWVVKTFLTPPDRDQELLAVRNDVMGQTLAKHYGNLYNRANPPRKVDFLEASYIEVADSGKLYAAEAYVEGEYVKYSNNSGWFDIADNRNTPHAFSHFTYVKSGGELIIVDIQGVGDLFTDPVVHHRAVSNPAPGDLGLRGISLFLYSHECSGLCRLLGLPPFRLFSESRPTSLREWRGLTCGSFTDILSLSKSSQSASSSSNSSPMIPSDLPDFSSSSSSTTTTSSAPSEDHPLREIIPSEIPEECPADGHVHHMLGRLHSLGRIAQLDDSFAPDQSTPSQPNFSAAFWHLQKSAHQGNLPSILALARLYSGLQRDNVLEPITIGANLALSLNYHILAAQRRHRPSQAIVAKAFQKGHLGAKPDWVQAVRYFNLLLEGSQPSYLSDPNFDHYGYTEDMVPPDYELHAALAQMHQEGRHGLEEDLAKAFEFWNNAGELATSAGKGRLASQYFEKSAECDC